MFYLVLTIHVILCFLIIGLVLLQQGKGAQVGAILSGSSNTLFGAAGATTTLAKLTTWFAIAFFVSSVLLIKIYGSDAGSISRGAALPAANQLEGSVLGEIVKQPAPVNAAAPAAGAETAQAPVAAVPPMPAPQAPLSQEQVSQSQGAPVAAK
jgi:preprotein translocase subunit SecG